MKKFSTLIILFLVLISTLAQARPHFSIGISLPIVTPCDPIYSQRCYPRYYPSYALTTPHHCTPVYVPSYLQTTVTTYTVPTIPVYITERQSVAPNPPQNITVIQVQTILKQRKYYSGIVDGLMGRATSTAIQKYQTDRNLPATGQIDATLLNDLGL
jgi:His-Xaa-Ser repeat protein HxsA